MALLESIGDPTLTIGLAPWAITIWYDTGEIATTLRWSQTVIDLAGGDPTRAPASVSDRRWRWRWQLAATLDGGWAGEDGVRTSTTPL